MEKTLWDGEPCRYRVHVFTGSRLGASTKAEVKIVLCGDNGRTEDLWLQDSNNHKIKFQKAQEDIFDLETFYVGPLRKISIGHDRLELGYGWFVDRVIVKDRVRRVRYDIACEKWLSAKEGDGSTVKQFDVSNFIAYEEDDRSEDESTQHNGPKTVNVYRGDSPRSQSPQPKQASPRDRHDADDASSHTSVNTIPSESRDMERRRPDSPASSYTTSETSSYSSHPSIDPATPRRSKTPDEHPPPPLTLSTRKDDFFDQSVPERDYASVIESLTDDRREDDFATGERYQARSASAVPSHGGGGDTVTLSLEGVREEEEVQRGRTVFREDPTDSESETARISAEPETDTARSARVRPEENYMDGFKAGLDAAKKSQEFSPDHETKADKVDNENTILQGPSIHSAAKSGDLERIKELANHNKDILLQTDEKGQCAIHISATHGQTEVLQWLSVNLTDIDMATPTGYTPIHLAALNGHTKSVMVLAAMGALIGSETVEQQNALHLASMGGHLETVKWLIANRASINSQDLQGRTALDIAEQYDHHQVAELLRACKNEQDDPNSSLSQLRSKSTLRDSSSDESSDSSSDSSDSSDSNSHQPTHSPNRPTSAKAGRRSTERVTALYSSDSATDSDADTKAKQKHDKEIEEKRLLYEEQQSQMAVKQTSFLDSIRDEYS